MWVATTDEEANFIFDLLADPDASEPALEYAQWLEDRGQPHAAEFLRLALLPRDNEPRLTTLRQQLDARWIRTVTNRSFRPNDTVGIKGGSLEGMEGTIVEVDAPAGRVALILNIFCRPTVIWVNFADLHLLKRLRAMTAGRGDHNLSSNAEPPRA